MTVFRYVITVISYSSLMRLNLIIFYFSSEVLKENFCDYFMYSKDDRINHL